MHVTGGQRKPATATEIHEGRQLSPIKSERTARQLVWTKVGITQQLLVDSTRITQIEIRLETINQENQDMKRGLVSAQMIVNLGFKFSVRPMLTANKNSRKTKRSVYFA
jgi:hypothetical protein